MRCLLDQVMAVVTENSANFHIVPSPPHESMKLRSVRCLASQVFLTCVCHAKCTLGYSDPATALLWASRFLTDNTGVVRGAVLSAKWMRLWTSNGDASRLLVEVSGAATFLQGTFGSESPSDEPWVYDAGFEWIYDNQVVAVEPDEEEEYLPELPF